MKCQLATLAVAASFAASSVSASSTQRNSFMKAMKSHGDRRVAKDQTPTARTLAEEMTGKSKRARELRKKVMAKAKFVAPPGRHLQDEDADGTDDALAFSAAGQWDNTFQFDATQFSLSYHRCAAVKQFDDELAATEDSTTVFTTKNFAVFRFCPSSTCEGTLQEEEVEFDPTAEIEEVVEGEIAEDAEYVDDMFERLKKGGANGSGCSSNYGEYVMELSDYLSLMTEYHNERFEKYCEDCEECMYDVYMAWMKNGYQNRNLKERSDKSYLDDLESDDFKNYHRELGNQYNKYTACPEYDTCHIYKNICEAGLEETYTQYFECTKVERNNGQTIYIAPHCASDGVNVTLGAYSDEDCSEFVGSGLDLSNYIGFKLDPDALAPYVTGSLIDVIPSESIQSQKERYEQIAMYDTEFVGGLPADSMCIPCHASKQAYEQRVGEYVEDEEYEVSEICTNLYALSARCDKHYRTFSSKTSSSAYAQALFEEEMSCDFIDSIVMGNYDESGFAVFNMEDYTTNKNLFTDNVVWEEYGHNVTDVNTTQIIGLTVALGACAVLAAWAGSLHKSLSKGTSWRPRKSMKLNRGEDAVTMQRRVSYVEPEDLTARQGSYYMS